MCKEFGRVWMEGKLGNFCKFKDLRFKYGGIWKKWGNVGEE